VEVDMSLELAVPASDAALADALPPPFSRSYTNGGVDAAWVHVGGELDIATTPQLERTLDASRARLVVLDLRELAFIDSCGIHAIVRAGIRARQAGRRLVLVRVPSDVDRILTLTGSSDQVAIGDVDPVAPPVHAVQRSLVARSLLMADKTPRNREPAR
jgi:anti-sigma B factor antagonist